MANFHANRPAASSEHAGRIRTTTILLQKISFFVQNGRLLHPDEPNILPQQHIVGTAVPRKEGLDKVTGRARYVDDVTPPGLLHGATVRSKVPRGKIRQIGFGPGVEWSEYVVVTAKDIPGRNCIALILD